MAAAVARGQCSSPTLVPDQTINSGSANYSDNNVLKAASVVVNGSASVTFFAGHCIELAPGFHATAGTAATTFHAWVDTAPAGLSVLPASGSGMSQQFTWTASSPAGYASLTDLHALFAPSISGQNACYIRYNQTSNLLYLADNAGSTWLGALVPRTSGTASNGQCTIDAGASSVSVSGNQLTVSVSVTFQPAFSGAQNDYLIAYDQYGLNSAWQQAGTWTVTPNLYSISGQVTASGAGMSGVTVTLSGGQSATTTTNSSGNYSFANVAGGGNYTVTASKSGSTFSPGSASVTNLAANWTAPTLVAVPPSITTSSLPSGGLNTAYSVTLTAGGGATPYTWSLTSGSLPPGLALSNAGVLSGRPTTLGNYNPTIQVTGQDGVWSSQQFSLPVTGPPALTITASHTGNFTQAQTGATYTLVVSNTGTGATNGTTVVVAETVPGGLIPTAISGTNWNCTQPAGPCTRTDALAAGTSYRAITMTVSVAPNAPASVTNQANVAGGGAAGSAGTDPTTIAVLPRSANPLAFATTASAIGGVATTFSVTYASDNGPSDIASGQVKIDNCYLAWDSAGNVRLYGGSGFLDATGVLGQSPVLWAGNCSINLAASGLSTPAANPKALVLTLNIAFPVQDFLNASQPDFSGQHETYAWGTAAGVS
jgi:hypothetical protein